jgi:hypothetical protein
MAHGEEALLLPVGNLFALIVVAIAALSLKVEWPSRVVAVLIAIVVSLPPYFVTNRYVPYWLSFSALGWFAVGLLPPIAVSAAFLLWRRRAAHKKGNGSTEST